jgi:RimJ/RimL family protein N-acetyltransferase
MAELAFPDPPLADDLIRLRPWREADFEPAHAATRDPLISRYTRVPVDQTMDELRAYIVNSELRRQAGELLFFAIADVKSDAFLGIVALQRFDWVQRRGEIGYWLASGSRGRGVASRAVRMLAAWGLRHLGLARLALCTDVDNIPSQGVAQRCGFAREGILRSFEERKGHRYDVVLYSLLPADLT